MDRNYDVIILISKFLNLRRSRVAIFADIIKIIAIDFKKSLKIQKKLKEWEIMHQNAIHICISWYNKNYWLLFAFFLMRFFFYFSVNYTTYILSPNQINKLLGSIHRRSQGFYFASEVFQHFSISQVDS